MEIIILKQVSDQAIWAKDTDTYKIKELNELHTESGLNGHHAENQINID